LRPGCEPLSPSGKCISESKITRTHAPFDILRQLGEVLDLPFHLLQFDIGKI